MNGLGNDFYDPSSRSPPRARSTNTQTLGRHASRPSDFYSPAMQDSMYSDDPSSRYDPSRFHDRMGSTMQNFAGAGGAGYDMGVPQAWNSSGFTQNNHLAALGATTRGKPTGRNGLPSLWLDQPQPLHPQGNFGGFGGAGLGYKPMRSDQLNAEGDDELIPTAIVIKNIPFAVKKEQLVQVMTDMNLPLPYAFNYHFDNGVFRGLAFANFTTPDETAAVITAMNHLELHGRKLRVEYKKMLPQAERDRIEREKRERRGQLEEQHRPLAGAQLNNQPSLSSVGSHVNATSPSPLSGHPGEPSLDMNDPITLRYYSQLILFQGDPAQGDVFAFAPDLPSAHRTVIHGLAHRLGLHHESHGSGNERRVHVYRAPAGTSPVNQQFANDPNRRVLNRAATTDFSSVRHNEASLYGGPASQSSGFLGFGDNQNGLAVASNLRAAKSFADLRSYTPSPAQSTNSFPANLAPNVARFQEYAPGSPGTRSNVTPTTTAMPDNIINGMGTMSLEHGFAPRSGSPQRVRGMVSWERDGREPAGAVPGPIGGHRQYSGNQDEQSRTRSSGSLRQNRNPLQDRAGGYSRSRQNGHQPRGSDEMSSPSNVEIVVE